MKEKELLELIKQGEGLKLEFKRSLADDDKIVEELASFANTSGGTVVVGVRDSGEVVGVSIGANTETKIGPGDKWMGEATLPPELNERQRKAIEYIQETGSIATREYREINKIGKVQAVKELNELVKKGVIKREGKGRATKYTRVND